MIISSNKARHTVDVKLLERLLTGMQSPHFNWWYFYRGMGDYISINDFYLAIKGHNSTEATFVCLERPHFFQSNFYRAGRVHNSIGEIITTLRVATSQLEQLMPGSAESYFNQSNIYRDKWSHFNWCDFYRAMGDRISTEAVFTASVVYISFRATLQRYQ